MRSLIWLLLAAVSVPTAALAAEWVPVREDGEALSVRVVETNSLRTVLKYEVSGFERGTVSINGEVYDVINLAGEPRTYDVGFPALPRICRSVIIPDDAKMSIRVLDWQYEDLRGMLIAPSKGLLTRDVNPADVPYVFDEFYQRDEWYPAEVATHGSPYILRDYRGMVVEVHPFQYNPATRTLRVTTRLEIEVIQAGRGTVNTLDRVGSPREIPQDFGQIYVDHFLNYTPSRYASVSEQGEMLVITYDGFHTTVDPLVQWKNEMGMRTRIFDISGIGFDALNIKDFISAYYDSTNLVYVLLVGDAPQIPTMHASGGASDPRYTLLVGDDYYPEIIIGRLSGLNTTEIQTQVERIIDYDKYPQAGAAWYHKGVGIASDEGPGDDGEMDWEHVDNIRTDLLGYTYTAVDQIYDPGATAAMVTTALQDGRSIINYCGHGNITRWSTSGFSQASVNALTNDNMLPFIFDCACLNGSFEYYTCFAESWMRATNNGVPTGAIGIYASSVNQYWDPPMAAQDEMNDLLVQDEKRTFGGLCFNGSMRMIDEYYQDGSYMFRTWNVFGDPSLRVRTDAPAAMSVVHDETMTAFAPTYEVTVAGVEGALCGLSYNGEYLGSGYTDDGGVAIAQVEAALPPEEDIDLTVTAYNRIPVYETVHVTSGYPPVLVVTPGNVAVLLEPGQTWAQFVTVSNGGPEGSYLTYDVSVAGGTPIWLDVQSNPRMLGAEEQDVVNLSFDATSLAEDVYTADLVISNNARDDLIVPVTLTVSTLTRVADVTGAAKTLALLPNFPNPFNPTTTLGFALPEPSRVDLKVYSIMGEEVRTLVGRVFPAGTHRAVWDGRNNRGEVMAAGVYLCRMEAAGKVMTQKIVMAK